MKLTENNLKPIKYKIWNPVENDIYYKLLEQVDRDIEDIGYELLYYKTWECICSNITDIIHNHFYDKMLEFLEKKD